MKALKYAHAPAIASTAPGIARGCGLATTRTNSGMRKAATTARVGAFPYFKTRELLRPWRMSAKHTTAVS